MKKRIRILMPALVTLAMLVSMFGVATPVMASEIVLAKNTLDTPDKYYLGDTIHYELEVGNPAGNAATNYLDFVEDYLPDGSTVTLATGVTQAPGVSNTYYLDYVVDEADLVYIGGRWRVVNYLHVEGTDSLEDLIDATTSKSSIILRPEISIDKTVDCDGDEEFADSETTVGPDTPTWRIVVCNTGFDPVSNIHVTDTNGEDYTIPELGAGACDTHEYVGAEINETTENTATAVGEDEIGGTVGPVSDSATNIIIHPDISIDKTVDCDGDGDFADEETTVGPDTPTWKIVVCNTGDVPVLNIHVTDTNGEDYYITSLAPGACDTHEYLGAEIDATTENTATAVAEDELGGTVGPVSDSATNIIIHPDISIDKTVDCDGDGDFADEETTVGPDTPTWKIVVCNTGDVPVLNIHVTDTNGEDYYITSLAPGACDTHEYLGAEIDATTENTATAQGEDELGGVVGPVSDSATNIIIHPCIDILKLVDCNDDQVYLPEDTGSYGDTPSWYIRVWNCGDTPLLNVMVSDTNGMSWSAFDLVNPGDFWEVYYDGVPIYEDTTNTAEAVAEDIIGGTVGPVYSSATNLIVGEEGCTPGYWKNNAAKWGAVSWVGYAPGDSFETVFGVDVTLRGNGKATYPTPTLLQALGANGGGINALARHAVAALLNISNPNVNYAGGMAAATLILAVQDAVAAGEDAIEALHTELAGYNEAGCPINQRGEPIIPEDGMVF